MYSTNNRTLIFVLTVQAVCDPDRQAYPAGHVVQEVAPAREYYNIKGQFHYITSFDVMLQKKLDTS